MSDTEKPGDMDAPTELIQQLEQAGFFSQLSTLQANLQRISADIGQVAEIATKRLQETEDLAAHVLAIESILEVMMRSAPVDAEAVSEAIRARTSELTGTPEGSAVVQSAAAELLARTRN